MISTIVKRVCNFRVFSESFGCRYQKYCYSDMGKRKAPADSDNKSDAEKTTKTSVTMKGSQSKKAKDVNAIDSTIGDVVEKQKSEKKAPAKGRQSKKAKEAAVDDSTNGDAVKIQKPEKKAPAKGRQSKNTKETAVDDSTSSDSKPTKEKKKPEKKSPAGSKKKKDKNDDAKNDDGAEEAVPAKKAKVTDFGSNAVTKDGKKWNLKIVSWNVNGIRAWVGKGCLDYLKAENADIYCLQETKCDKESLPDEVTQLPGYHAYWLSADKGGYSGVGLYSKTVPLCVSYGIGIEKHDNEGRVITAEYPSFYLINAYVPNSGRGLPRLPYRSKEWDVDFRQYLKELDKKKPIILCGDLNVAHNEIDIANPKSNKKSAGFTEEEREGFTNLLAEGYVDTFRHLYPDVTGAYTYWNYMFNSRAKNVGWRLDYFVMSSGFAAKALCDSVIRSDTTGSDHCPIALLLNTQ